MRSRLALASPSYSWRTSRMDQSRSFEGTAGDAEDMIFDLGSRPGRRGSKWNPAAPRSKEMPSMRTRTGRYEFQVIPAGMQAKSGVQPSKEKAALISQGRRAGACYSTPRRVDLTRWTLREPRFPGHRKG